MKRDLASLAASIVMLMSTFTLGCGADCKSNCERAQESGCGHLWVKREALDPASPPRATAVDCGSLCEDLEATSEAAECTSRFDEYIGCLDDQRNVCEAGSCGSEQGRLALCLFPYCLEHSGGACPR